MINSLTPFFNKYNMGKASKVICDAIIGNDFRTVVIGTTPYTIYPPTINKIAGAVSCLSEIELKDDDSIRNMLFSQKDCKQYAHALSWMIKGDDSISEELSKGKYEEIVLALDMSFSLISPKVFSIAVNLTKNASLLAAKQKS